MEFDRSGERLKFFWQRAAGGSPWRRICPRRRDMSASPGLERAAGRYRARRHARRRFRLALAARSWAIRQKSERRAHLLLLHSDRGRASWHGTGVALEAPALLWLPGSIDATVEVGPGAHGFCCRGTMISPPRSRSSPAMPRRCTCAGPPSALRWSAAKHFRHFSTPSLNPAAPSCAELRTPGFGGATLISSHPAVAVPAARAAQRLA